MNISVGTSDSRRHGARGTCAVCGGSFNKQSWNQKICSRKCRAEHHSQKYWRGAVSSMRNRTMNGAASELQVCADLLRYGIHTFRAQSPDAPCDLIALVEGEPMRVQVKTDNRVIQGEFRPVGFEQEQGRFDIYASVSPDGIRYHDRDMNQIYPSELLGGS